MWFFNDCQGVIVPILGNVLVDRVYLCVGCAGEQGMLLFRDTANWHHVKRGSRLCAYLKYLNQPGHLLQLNSLLV